MNFQNYAILQNFYENSIIIITQKNKDDPLMDMVAFEFLTRHFEISIHVGIKYMHRGTML